MSFNHQLSRVHALVAPRVSPLSDPHPAYVLFFSVADRGPKQAIVVQASGASFDEAWHSGAAQIDAAREAAGLSGEWLRVDWPASVEALSWAAFQKKLSRTKRGYFRHGVALDAALSVAFLEQELNAHAMLYGGSDVAHAVLNVKNFEKYARARHPQADTRLASWADKPVYLLSTHGVFSDAQGQAHVLAGPDGADAGRRVLGPMQATDVQALVVRGADYLAGQVGLDGKFIYGWFPCFDRPIPAYNALRHASSTYAMVEAWEVTRSDALKRAIDRALRYLITTLIRDARVPEGQAAFVVDTGDEIKLGANAVAILALTKYCEVTGERDYLPLLEKLALGIRAMQRAEDGGFVHVLHAADLSVKEPFRIIYYDGEAAFALMRLYGLTRDARWLATVERAFEYFIAQRHWRAHDHWLGYCVNELTQYRPEERYFRFGLQNVAGYLDFVLQRVTTFPTLLELMMAAHRMMARIATMPAMRHLLDEIDQEKFARALHHRANHLLNGHFWPELAMYYRNPGRIVGSFFIRHQAFRVRIDDVEHYLSGLCAYLADGVPGAQAAVPHASTALETGSASRVAAQPVPDNAGGAAAPARVHTTVATSTPSTRPGRGWTAAELASLLDGEWLVAPPSDWQACDLSIMRGGEDIESPDTLFIAIDEDTWHRGSGNRGVYAGWPDTHEALATLHGRCAGALVQRHVPGLPADFPQLRVKDTYQTIARLGEVARQRMQGQVVAITGTVGKSTVKGMLDDVLGEQGRVIATRGNHNTRTGVPLTLARAITDPDVCVLEVAMSALWMRSGGICQLARPHVAVVTEVGVGQVRPGLEDEAATARYKARVCQGLLPGGCALLNRDMAAFEIVRDEAIGYDARVVTYGFHPEADIRVVHYTPDPQGSDVVVQMGEQQLRYRVPVPGRAMVSNTLATLGVVQALEQDVAAAAARLAAYGTIHGRLETSQVALPSGGHVTLIDDSHNAEILSMKAAFEVAALHPAGNGRRRIAVLGRIINLGEQAPALHASLAEPLLAAGFGRVFLHGEEMTHLAQRLPAELLGGCFQDAASLVQAVAAETQAGDTVLLKGSLRKSDFRRVPALLRARWKQGRPGVPPAAPASTIDTASVAQPSGGRLILDLDQTEPLLADQADVPIAPGGFTQFLLLLLCCERLAQGKIKLDERISVAEGSDAPGAAEPRVGLQRGHVLTVRELIGAVALFNARDAAIVLAERLEGKSSQAVAALRTLASSIGLSATTLRSVTGRNVPGQQTTLRDMARAVAYFAAVYPHRLHWLSATDGVWLGRLRRKPGNLVASGVAAWAFDGGGASRSGFAVVRVSGRDRLFCASGAHDSFNLDFRLRALIAHGERQVLAPVTQSVVPHVLRPRRGDAVRVNLLGDTYFGEWYTRRRQSRGIEDALTRHGYDHSFEGIRPLLDTGDFNIANFEAALSQEPEGALRGRKPFVLVGDPQASVDALRRQGIHAVALGNNHAFDAGLSGLQETLQAFDGAGIARFGAGLDAQQAEAPLVLRVGARTIKLYSAYWYRPYMEEDCAFYAMPERPGAACLSGGLLDAIRAEKQRPDPATVIVLAHWGGDYTWTNGLQRRLAAQLLEAGADTIIGSGPHMLGEFDCLDGKWVAYSIGNGVFNSNGEYAQRGMPPFGFVAQLVLGAGVDQLRLYPVFTDNTATFWQPRLVDEAQFQRVRDALAARGVAVLERAPVGDAQAAWSTRDDAGRWMIVLPLVRAQGQVQENASEGARSGASTGMRRASLAHASDTGGTSAAAATADARATAVVSQVGKTTSAAADADLTPGSLYAPERLAAITGGAWVQPASTHATPVDAAQQALTPQTPAVAAGASAAQDKAAPPADPVNLAYLPKTWVPGSMAVVLERGSNFGFSPAQLTRLGDEVAGAIGTSATSPVPGRPYLRVPNILQSMVDLAQYARRRHAGRIVAVTGSAGKSGSCDMLTHALEQLHGPAHVASSEKNENLILGVTRTLANLQGDETRVVLEIAAGHAARCAGIARPHVALFTNVSHAHLSYYGTVEAVGDLKAALFDHLTVDGTAVVCRDTQLFDRVAERARRTGARLVTYGIHADADIRLLHYDLPSRTVRAQFFDETVSYVLGGEGEHLATNSLGVLACLHALGDDWRAAMAGLADWQPLEGRGNRFTVDVADGGQATIIDESFNAAPLSMRAALRLLAARPTAGRRVAVLGEMRELGDQATTLHTDMAAFLADLPIDRVHVMGELYTDFWQQLPAARRGIHAATLDALDEAVRADLRDGDLVLFKGSHSSDIYQAVSKLRQGLPEAA